MIGKHMILIDYQQDFIDVHKVNKLKDTTSNMDNNIIYKKNQSKLCMHCIKIV